MKLLIISILAIATVAQSHQECEPNSFFRDYCNTCKCSSDGKLAACTIMACDPKVWNKDGTRKTRSIDVPKVQEDSEEKCKPYSVFKSYCNTCTCMPDGTGAACTRMACSPKIWNRDGTLKNIHEIRNSRSIQESEHVCEPGTTYFDGCNTCSCGDDGKPAYCTLKLCYTETLTPYKPEIIEEPKIAKPEYHCEPNTTFKNYCNTCHCSHDGKIAACTLMGCDPRVWNKDGTLKHGAESIFDEEIERIDPVEYLK